MFHKDENSYPFPPRLLTWEEAAYYIRVKSINTVKKLAFEGEIKVCVRKPGAHPKVVRDSLDQWIDEHTIDYNDITKL